jgi:uncharacterized protein YcnI
VKRKLSIAASAIALAAPAATQAHITVQPEEVPAGGFARLDVRVPNERDGATTDKVEVRMPDGFLFVSHEPVAGWKVNVRTERLDQPVEAFGEEISEQIATITWTAADRAAAIGPGQFRDFGLSVGMPENAAEGETLTFPALQTYSSGEVVRWIGSPDAEEPAPTVTLTASEEAEADAGSSDESGEASESNDDDDDGTPLALGIAALVVGGLGLVAGGSSLARSRRS